MTNRFQPSNGAFVYLLGLVIIASHPERFWLGLGVAATPILVDTAYLISGKRYRL